MNWEYFALNNVTNQISSSNNLEPWEEDYANQYQIININDTFIIPILIEKTIV